MIKHHVDPETLMSYAAGTSSMPVSLIVASHITICDKCRKDVQLFEDIGGKVLEESLSFKTKPETLDIMLSKLDDIDIETETSSDIKVNSIFKNIPIVLHKMLPKGNSLTEKWKNGIGGIKYYDIELGESNKNSHARMFSIPPGKALPKHGHEAQEYTLVLEGGFSDKNGDYNAGDIAIEDELDIHSPVADSTEGCVCLAVYEGNLKFKGILGPILNLLKI